MRTGLTTVKCLLITGILTCSCGSQVILDRRASGLSHDSISMAKASTCSDKISIFLNVASVRAAEARIAYNKNDSAMFTSSLAAYRKIMEEGILKQIRNASLSKLDIQTIRKKVKTVITKHKTLIKDIEHTCSTKEKQIILTVLEAIDSVLYEASNK